MDEEVSIFEVGPRDGLQNESRIIPTADKVKLVDMLSECGLRHIEAASFVSPAWVPQMADSAELMAAIQRRAGVIYAALTPNLRGYFRAKDSRVDMMAVFISASEGFSHRNLNCSMAQSIERAGQVAAAARRDGIPLRGYVSCVVHCPYDGPTAPEAVARAVGALLEIGCVEVSLGDTTGTASPGEIEAMLNVLLARFQAARLAGHYHDTSGRALDNIEVSLSKGLRRFDASVGGLGGCPFAPGAKGNVATESVVRFLAACGYRTDTDTERLAGVADYARSLRRASQ